MKKILKSSIFILILLCLLSFFTPHIVNANTNTVATVSGKVIDKEGNGVQGVKIYLCNEDGEHDNNYVQTDNEGKYTLGVGEGANKYRLKFEYQGYENSVAYKEEPTLGDCEKINVIYGIPTEDSDALIMLETVLTKQARIMNKEVVSYKRFYNGNTIKYQDEEGNEITTTGKLTKEINSIGDKSMWSPIDTVKTVIVIKVDDENAINNIIGDLEPKESGDTDKYKYFIVLDEKIRNTDAANKLKAINYPERLQICENNYLFDVLNYIGDGEATKTQIGTGNNSFCMTDDGDKVISVDDGNVNINLELGEKSEEMPEVASGSDITGKIYVDGKLMSGDTPIYVQLSKSGVDDKRSGRTSDTGEFGFSYIPTPKKDDEVTYNGTYIITAIMGGFKNTTLQGYNGQNYEIDKILINDREISNSDIRNNSGEINSYFAMVNKDNATLVKEKNGEEKAAVEYANRVGELEQKVALEINTSFGIGNADEGETNTVDIYFKTRPTFKLDVSKNITLAQITLSDGQILETYKKGDTKGKVGNKLIKWDIDDELKHGATVEIEYEITIKNSGSIDCTEYTLVDYLDYNNGSLQYRSDAKMITEDRKNSDYGWKIINAEDAEFTDNKKLQDITESELTDGKTYLKINWSQGSNSSSGVTYATLKPEESHTYKLMASIVITSTSMYNYQNSIELVEYKNAIGRVDTTAIPGNYHPELQGQTGLGAYSLELDYGEAEELSITPPTGTEKKWYTKILEIILNTIN